MTIDESISELKWVRKVNEEILKTDAKEIDVDSAWIKHWENVVKSLDVAIETMRKYQMFQDQSLSMYMERLKADMVAMLTEIQLEIEEVEIDCPFGFEPVSKTSAFYEGVSASSKVIQQKINALKADRSVEV